LRCSRDKDVTAFAHPPEPKRSSSIVDVIASQRLSQN
jgi:hypothetical protein